MQWESDRASDLENGRSKKLLYPVMLDDSLLGWDDPRAVRVLRLLALDFRKATRGAPMSKADRDHTLAAEFHTPAADPHELDRTGTGYNTLGPNHPTGTIPLNLSVVNRPARSASYARVF